MKKKFRIFCLFIFFSSANVAWAEYRAFVLHIINSKTQVYRQVQSTLDPDQYKTQFPLNTDEKITYVDTWRCLGRTDFLQPVCDKPDRNPAAVPSQSPESEKNKK